MLTRIGSFFDLFDLSFFVSGSVALAGVWLWMYLSGKQWPFRPEGWLRVLAIILACYVLGLICFALGRCVRVPLTQTRHFQKFESYFFTVLKAHGLAEEEPFKSYIARSELHGGRRLYTRLWVEIRQKESLAPSLLVLNRYWVMAATYDGMVTAVFMWLVLFIFWWRGIGIAPALSWRVAIPAIVFLVFLGYMCSREAGRLVRAQVEELVATIARERSFKN
jgi:hypothetical protein